MSAIRFLALVHGILFLFPFASSFPSGYTGFKGGYGQLDFSFYDWSCPRLQKIVKDGVWRALTSDTRMAASLLRMLFHDCFVNGCDASILLDETNDIKSEKNAFPNRDSVRGYEVIDDIKADVEAACPLTVSCADIVALAAREAVLLSGGPFWPVGLGRRDSLTANQQAANTDLPSPFEPLDNITAKFAAKGLDMKDVVVLSGAHTIGFARCLSFKYRLFDFRNSGVPDQTLESSLLTKLQDTCPNVESSNANLTPLDTVSSATFDNSYYTNLMNNAGLLESDQLLMSDLRTSPLVKAYSNRPFLFYSDFAVSIMKMSSVGVLTGNDGEIRKKCGSVN